MYDVNADRDYTEQTASPSNLQLATLKDARDLGLLVGTSRSLRRDDTAWVHDDSKIGNQKDSDKLTNQATYYIQQHKTCGPT